MRRARKLLGSALVVALLALALVVLVPAMTGRPVVTYAHSGSMEPTIGLFDAFLVSPWTRDVGVGDIIVFESVTHGGPAVHRIVGGDARGWTTQGDANALPDQAGREPYVTPDRILGKVVTVDDAPILIPEAGKGLVEAKISLTRAANAVGGGRFLVASIFLALAAASAIPALTHRRAPRSPARMPRALRQALRRAFPRGILGRHLGLALLLVLVASTAWAASQARADVPLGLVVVKDPTAADGVRAAAPGGSISREVQVGALGFLPTIVILEPASDRLLAPEPTAQIAARAVARLPVEHRAGDTVGYHEDALHLWRYPALMPAPIIIAMHGLAPGMPYAAVGAALAGIGAVWFWALGVARLPVGRLLGMREGWL